MRDGDDLPRVLLVDDDRLQREMARDALGRHFDLVLCESGAEALAALAEAPADIVVTDLTMPAMGGLDLLRRVRREHPEVDLVLVTANASIQSAVEALRMGAADYLLKPVQWEELQLVLERVLVRQGLVEENDRLRESLFTIESCRVLASCLDAGDVHAVSLDLVLRILGSERGLAIYIRATAPAEGLELRGYREDEASRLRRVLSRGEPIDLWHQDRIQLLTEGPVTEALREAGLPAVPVLAVPIPGEERERGLLLVPDEAGSFEDAMYEQLGVVAAHATVALRNAERYERAKERAITDDVTDLYNARYLLEALDREIQRADRYRHELSVVFLDLDRFKLVNDQYGHLVGSEALRQLARVLLQCVRQVDTLARYGGDEFTIVLPDTDEKAAGQVAERIRAAVAGAPFEAARGQTMRLTCSLGCATFPQHGRDRATLLDAADKAMYRAKSLGRDRVCSASQLAE